MEEDLDRYSRQSLLVPREKIEQVHALVVGVGSVGRQVALQLTAAGVPHLTLVDMDDVTISNTASQGYPDVSQGQKKVIVTKNDCLRINPTVEIATHYRPFRSCDKGTHVFCCVDCMTARKNIFKQTEDERSFFVDGRVGGETLRIITAYDYETRKYWEDTWFPNSEGENLMCGARMTLYCATITASFMVVQFTKFLREFWVPKDILMSLLGMNILFDVVNSPNQGNNE